MIDVLLSEIHYRRYLQKLRLRLAQAYDNATKILAKFDAEIFVRSPHPLYLWAALPGVTDSLTLAEELLPRKILMAPGRIFCVDPSVTSRWSRFNIGAVGDPRFATALRSTLSRLQNADPKTSAGLSTQKRSRADLLHRHSEQWKTCTIP